MYIPNNLNILYNTIKEQNMKKIFIPVLISLLFAPIFVGAEIMFAKPSDASIISENKTATITWNNPVDSNFASTILFRSNFPIENYFSYKAVEDYCDKLYEGKNENFTDTDFAENLSYYYILFASDTSGNYSGATVLEKSPTDKTEKPKSDKASSSLIGADSTTVNEISFNEAGLVYNFNKTVVPDANSDSQRLALFIIVKSPHDLGEKDKKAISYFIDAGTPTTIVLGSGERAGVLNSYLSVFDKLPRNVLEWQDIIKIANGRWPDERSEQREKLASENYFSAIYHREPNMENTNDNAAITVIAYGLRPAQRNMESESKAIDIYRAIFQKNPVEASDWDLVRAIAYSGAVR